MATDIDRRKFLKAASATAAAFTIVPRNVLGGPGVVAPSEKITLAHIGFGTQSIREVGALLANPQIQIVAVCDPEKDGTHYVEWSRKGQLREVVRKLLDEPDLASRRRPRARAAATWERRSSRRTMPSSGPPSKFKGCATYVDFRELLERGKGRGRGQGDDARPSARGRVDCGDEEGQARGGSQAAGQSAAGSQAGHRNGPADEGRHALSARQRRDARFVWRPT